MVNALEITFKDITEVIIYLLGSTQWATFTMVSHEEAVKDMKATQARLQMAELKRILDEEKDIIETNRDHMQQPTQSMYNADDIGDPETYMELLRLEELDKQVKSCFIDQAKLKQISDKIQSYMKEITSILKELPASKRDRLEPCLSRLHVECVGFS